MPSRESQKFKTKWMVMYNGRYGKSGCSLYCDDWLACGMELDAGQEIAGTAIEA